MREMNASSLKMALLLTDTFNDISASSAGANFIMSKAIIAEKNVHISTYGNPPKTKRLESCCIFAYTPIHNGMHATAVATSPLQ